MRKRVDPGGVHRESDGFWSKVLVLTIVVIWVSLVAGQWVARWAIDNGKFAGKATASTGASREPEVRPEYTRTPMHESLVTPTPEDLPSPSASATAATAPATVAPTPQVNASPSSLPSPSPEETLSQTPLLPPSETPSASASTETAHEWTLQLGVFVSQENADKLAGDLRSAGYTVDVAANPTASETTYVVRVGHFNTKAEAVAEQGKLQAHGFHPLPVAR